MKTKKIIIVMGVSGSGKSTIAYLLSKALSIPYYDADDFHPEVNLQKMSNGEALTDEDRQPWLQRLGEKMNESQNAIIACSALKKAYRDYLEDSINSNKIVWVYLKGTKELIHQRMLEREHFMPPSLLDSQFETLEEPINAIVCDIADNANSIVDYIVKELKESKV